MSVAKVLQYLYSAQAHARGACDRTRQMVREAIARFKTLLLIERVAA